MPNEKHLVKQTWLKNPHLPAKIPSQAHPSGHTQIQGVPKERPAPAPAPRPTPNKK
jgi:hypothetical protein